ncbi:LacI family DNA-binding transcriptional regulator [uncultured Streptomyces sp.]|uniref:LacI family DNA-binding transcriptional regulator n=1 Tax=uncultured Streptomyces sp. TaxID=174707 RepID=UPI0026116B77|nr:LacI family DNA-binding transcriptional regulator [uncultured Streptomyces sp.]
MSDQTADSPPPDVRPTLEAVAARAGVSRATASRVVNGGAGVRPHLVERVNVAVEELGYVPNHAARTLVTRRNGAVAVIIDEPEFRVFSDPFFSRQIRGISRELVLHDVQLVLLLVEGSGDFDRVSRYLAGGHVDGVLAFSLHTDDELPAVIGRFRVPVVYGGRPGPGDPAPDVGYVDCDNRGGARQAVAHLVSLGRRRIAHIAGPVHQTSALDRAEGYRATLPDGLPALIEEGDFTAEGGAAAMSRLLEREPAVDAVFVANDLMASGALRALAEHGRRVPEDVAVVGFDDMAPVAETTAPPLTTVRQDVEGMGRLMVRRLMRRLDEGPGADASPVITPTELVLRGSA